MMEGNQVLVQKKGHSGNLVEIINALGRRKWVWWLHLLYTDSEIT